jgi:ABC-type nickel/cobalt efflux system permease component RcnA
MNIEYLTSRGLCQEGIEKTPDWGDDGSGFPLSARADYLFPMETSTTILLVSAVSIGFLHTLLGPDHYIPFVAMARVGGWSKRKTLLITVLCGLGHVAGSVLLGVVGIAFGLSLSRLETVEASRGSWAAWALIVFGILYTVWGLRRATRGHTHSHLHPHADGTIHSHPHSHSGDHLHPHADPTRAQMTPWVLFVIFLLGPCEALIPILMFPAATQSWAALFLVTGVFGAATILTMSGLVLLGLEGIQRLPFPRAQRFGHALAGLAVLLCGVAIEFIGL